MALLVGGCSLAAEITKNEELTTNIGLTQSIEDRP
jgi:hypothetical protein